MMHWCQILVFLLKHVGALNPDYVDLPQTYHEEENNRMNLSTVDEARS